MKETVKKEPVNKFKRINTGKKLKETSVLKPLKSLIMQSLNATAADSS